ncbi:MULTISPECIES: hypothetical protein [Leptolyngbya]|uniref:hypothetical protein n=1 Tax=Leptolyngbya TaxID=47251 RepID=UPI001688BEEF|nr:hypothetical protein [Leptolyngbya sp. FACHB-1624]MBD1855514.1 hypothetical protein [Leptolyngbya sp. FACHB-1624]
MRTLDLLLKKFEEYGFEDFGILSIALFCLRIAISGMSYRSRLGMKFLNCLIVNRKELNCDNFLTDCRFSYLCCCIGTELGFRKLYENA